ncbi:Bax inhibitor-1 family protein [Gilvibacter sediminis]|uniref:Bax inhibitor-1/YccA family protein n=1 Tax=Gilvibacter sediminis TaxID=379071 RepID=UPI00234FFB00|nr:Bax inhibitor-1 family protein [Gilvibacter sediminis]MDC7998636.1 Bax inhibitor-1 family protein [Gilvibacter sediminis]
MEEIQQFNEPQVQEPMVADLAQEERVAFYRKTYGHVAGAVLLFIAVEAIFFQIPAVVNFAFSLAEGWTWLLLLGGFMFATSKAESMAMGTTDRNTQYAALVLYVVAEAFVFIPLIGIALYVAGDGAGELLNQAAIITLSLFSGLTAAVLLTKKDFSFLKTGLTIGFFIAIGLIIAGTLFGFDLGLWFSVGMIVLAAGSILYQTSQMVHKYKQEQYVAASLGLFGALMLLFWYVLSILSSD